MPDGVRQPVLERVRAYYAAGYHCLPVISRDKNFDLPAMGFGTGHPPFAERRRLAMSLVNAVGGHFALKPPGLDQAMSWNWQSDHNLAFLTGQDRLLVLDFDDLVAFDAWRTKHPVLAASTPVARSPRGMHVYLRSERAELSSSLYWGRKRIGHVKAFAGFIVAPGSISADGFEYHWLPGQSVFDMEPKPIASLAAIGLSHVSTHKRIYDRLFKGRTGAP
jgi:hypothetical protein